MPVFDPDPSFEGNNLRYFCSTRYCRWFGGLSSGTMCDSNLSYFPGIRIDTYIGDWVPLFFSDRNKKNIFWGWILCLEWWALLFRIVRSGICANLCSLLSPHCHNSTPRPQQQQIESTEIDFDKGLHCTGDSPQSKWTKFIQRVCFVPNNTTLDTFFKICAPFILSLYLHTCLLWICFISRQSFPLLPIIVCVWAGGTFLVLPPQKASLYILSILGLHFSQACARPGQFSEIAITVQKKCKQTVWPLFCFDMWQNLLSRQILWIVCA